MNLTQNQPAHLPLTPDERFNFLAFLSDMLSFFAASVLLSSITILPLFASRLTDRPEVIALIPALASLGMSLPQMLGARFVRGLTHYRPFVMRWAVAERLSVLGAVVSMVLLAKQHPALLLAVPMGFLFLWWTLMGINGPAYTAMLERCVAPRRRGRLFGIGAALGGITGLGFAWVARRLIENMEFPYGFAACAAVAAFTLILGITPLAFVREAEVPAAHQIDRGEGILAILRRDRRFRLYMVSQIAFAFQAMPTAIFTTYALGHFKAGPGDIVTITAVIAASGAVGSIAAGWLADHYGNRAVGLGSAVMAAAALVLAWSAPTLPLYIATFVPARLAISGADLSSFNILMEFARPGQVPSYSAAFAAASGPSRVVAPMLGGIVAATISPSAVFLLAALAAALCAATLVYVSEPRHPAPGLSGLDGG